MSKLKDINLKDLGSIKNKNIEDILNSNLEDKPKFEAKFSRAFESSLPSYSEKMMAKRKLYQEADERINSSINMNSKFLKHINFIENIKNKPGQYLDQRNQWEKDLESAEFTPPSKPIEKTIPLTFRKFFYQTFPHNINKFALQNPEKLPGLVADIRDKIQKEGSNWLDLVCDKQVGNLICQVENYSSKAKIFKRSSDFKNIIQVIQWIIDTNTKLLYEATDWNKAGEKVFSEDKGNLLIIDATLHKEIKIEEERIEDSSYKDKHRENPKEIFPLPLYGVWENFSAVIICPLKNNFQFIIIDQRALVGWKDFQKLEIKYDEDNSLTYFVRKMEGGFKQLTHYNAVAFISET